MQEKKFCAMQSQLLFLLCAMELRQPDLVYLLRVCISNYRGWIFGLRSMKIHVDFVVFTKFMRVLTKFFHSRYNFWHFGTGTHMPFCFLYRLNNCLCFILLSYVMFLFFPIAFESKLYSCDSREYSESLAWDSWQMTICGDWTKTFCLCLFWTDRRPPLSLNAGREDVAKGCLYLFQSNEELLVRTHTRPGFWEFLLIRMLKFLRGNRDFSRFYYLQMLIFRTHPLHHTQKRHLLPNSLFLHPI